MKKRIYILMAVLALLGAALYGLLSLHSRSSAASAIRDYEEIARSKLIRIIIADTDTTTAVLPALPQRIARQMLRHGVQVEYIRERSRSESLALLASGGCDIIAAPTVSPLEPTEDALYTTLLSYETETLYLLQPMIPDSLMISSLAGLDDVTLSLSDHGIEPWLLQHLAEEHHINLRIETTSLSPDSLWCEINEWHPSDSIPSASELQHRPLSVAYGFQRAALEQQYPAVHSDLPLTIDLPTYLIVRSSSPVLCDSLTAWLQPR